MSVLGEARRAGQQDGRRSGRGDVQRRVQLEANCSQAMLTKSLHCASLLTNGMIVRELHRVGQERNLLSPERPSDRTT